MPSMAEAEGLVPLLVVGESSLSRRLSVAALEQAGIEYEIVYVGGSFAGLVDAAKAGLGVVLLGAPAARSGRTFRDDNPRKLPRVPAVCGGVYLRDDVQLPEFEMLADEIAACVRGETVSTQPGLRVASR